MRNRPLLIAHPVWQFAFFALPRLLLVIVSFWRFDHYQLSQDRTFSNYCALFSQPPFIDALVTSLVLGLVNACLSVAVSTPVSVTMFFWIPKSVNTWLICLFLLPFLSSFTVRTFSWYIWLSDAGIVGAILRTLRCGPAHLLNGPFAVVIGELSVLAPVACLLSYSAISRLDRSILDAARNLGASGPQLLPYTM